MTQATTVEQSRASARPPPRSPSDVLSLLREHASSLIHLVERAPERTTGRILPHLDRAQGPDEVRAACAEVARDEEADAGWLGALRRARHSGLVRIALREILGLADVDETSAEMAHLADALIGLALVHERTELERELGRPVDQAQRPIAFVVLGMGKLGGLELNIGSDIDLCFFYGEDTEPNDHASRTAHEYFAQLAMRTTRALSEVTGDGFCFRVDLRLRPEGSSGPLVNSLASAETYYATWGRTWERAAMLRARPVAGDLALGDELLGLLAPWIFPREIDPSIAEEMHTLLRRTRRELRVEDSDIKLGVGGIREVEFLTQTLQLMWGGQFRELRIPGTIAALRRAAARGLLTHQEATDLEAAWALFRRVEHRVHLQSGYQTHRIPSEARIAPFARSLGFESREAFEHELAARRRRVTALFEGLRRGETSTDDDELEGLWASLLQGNDTDVSSQARDALGIRELEEGIAHLQTLSRRAASPLGPVTRERLPLIGMTILRGLRAAADPDRALRYTAQFFARLGDGSSYARRLVEEPRLARKLIGLFGASSTLSIALIGHPESVDLILGDTRAPGFVEIAAAHAKLRTLQDAQPVEEFVSDLRRLKRETTLQIGLAHVGHELSLDEVEQRLSALADAQVNAALSYAIGRTFLGDSTQRAELVVVGLGRLGASELGFGGDLDLIFIFATPEADADQECKERCTRAAQLTLRFLSQSDAEGPGYPMDTRLRPSGSHGTLVVSLRAFDAYHAGEAAPWERQALLRARVIAGDAHLRDAVSARLRAIPFEGAAPTATELAAMRHRLQSELAEESGERFHAKLGHGGLIDAEFLAQWLQMNHRAPSEPPVGHTLLALEHLEHRGVLEPDVARDLRSGYRFFRDIAHALRLMDENREPVLTESVTTPLARWLGVRDRDGVAKEEVLRAQWREHAERLRRRFEERVHPVGIAPPWAAP